jgi:Ca-activated chloride channel family protein
MKKWFILGLAVVALAACGAPPPAARSELRGTPTPTLCAPPLRIVAASEVKVLEDNKIFEGFTGQTCIQTSISYKGSVDIKNMVASYASNNPQDVDVFWAASPIGLPGTLVNAKATVMKTYPTLIVDKQKAAELGWDLKKGIETRDVITAIGAGKLTLAMPSASQDDAGAIFYLAVLSSIKGGIVQKADLSSPAITDGIKTLFGGVSRSAASADALRQIILQDRLSGKPQYAAAMLPEVMAIPLNRALVAKNVAPMMVFYLRDATDIETFPLGYVEKISDAKIAQYNALVAYLKSPQVQDKLKALGWRTNPVGMTVTNSDPAVFNPDWGIQTDAELAPITMPKEDVIDAALGLYQTSFRKPSNTVFCLDYSGSMQGSDDTSGERQLKNAMDLLLDQSRATDILLQSGSKDKVKVYGFSSRVFEIGKLVEGNDPKALKNLSDNIRLTTPAGSTAMFDCLRTALDFIGTSYDPKSYNYGVIAMTDGASNAGMTVSQFPSYYQTKKLAVPMYAIAFGDATFDQLNVLKTLKSGDVLVPGSVCDGRQGGAELIRCFREAKGSN